jgi:hypothetical protein
VPAFVRDQPPAEVEVPDVVYHYTNAAGLLGVLSTQQLWMTDTDFLNDAEELAYARGVPPYEVVGVIAVG